MQDMKKIASQFKNDHLKKGVVDKVTAYSFQYTTLPDKNGKTTSVVYMESYFTDL